MEETDREFSALLQQAGLTVPDEELPGLREQYDRMRRHLETLRRAGPDLGEIEPGFRFDAAWRS